MNLIYKNKKQQSHLEQRENSNLFRKRKGYKNIALNDLQSTKRLWVNRKNKEHKTAKKKEIQRQ
jgi:hypothetical protein